MKGRDKLERLRVVSPCTTSWEAMQGGGSRRHCQECNKPVYDFAALTPREIAGLLEASGGRLCGRLTRDAAGRLLTREPSPAPDPLAARRVSPLAAATVAAVVALGGGLAGAAQAGPAAAAASLAPEGAGEPQTWQNRPQRAGGAGVSISGSLVVEGGEAVPDAEVTLYNQLDG